ncbi:hypothetical protein CIPAW_10G123700 [Carya illinoinensis]|uniref:Myb/SANT-like domain-containing protein n=1 Tax=Carya illinoinensis TaxID=32201 RepID=A0A8T1P5A5_CARIL|nr:hypothetical protein I3842_Q031400 [Carya illinoinensis]KAG6639756.1 hypothetical protein CIPAW_10G123700 [Carya illinoinensis]
MDDTKNQRDLNLWTNGLEKMLVDLLYQETVDGKLVGSKITYRDNVRLATKMTELGKKTIDVAQIRGKITRLRQRQRLFTDLMGQTGMGWNPETKTVIATEEHWANAIRTNGCQDYNLLCTIFGQSVATGVLHYASTQEPPTYEEEDRLEEVLRARGPVLGTVTDAPIDLDEVDINIDGLARRQAGSTRRRRREPPRSGISPELSKAIEVMAASAASRAELDQKMFEEHCSRKRSKGEEESDQTASVSSSSMASKCVKFLNDINPPLSMDHYGLVAGILMHKDAQEFFLTMPPERRIGWIHGLK